jgi:inosine-uridine nucleoside N-ribohydrolase
VTLATYHQAQLQDRTSGSSHRFRAALHVAGGLLLPALLLACSPAAPSGPASGTPAASAVASPTGSGSAAAPLRLVIDTDMAADDIVAIASLLREPAVEVLGIAVTGTGEAHCPGGLFSARALVTTLADAPIPVACGPGAALGPAQEFPAEWRTGADAGYGLQLPAPAAPPDPRSAQQLILDLAAEAPLTLLTLGPLTNVAAAVRLDPTLPDRVTRLVAMAGAVDVAGNVQPFDGREGDPTAEWNLHADPTAAAIVFEAGFDLTLVPLDATNDVPLDQAFVDALATDHAAAPADVVLELYARNGYLVTGEPMLWDSLAAMVMLHPEVATFEERTVSIVEGDALDGGRTLADPDGAPVRAAMSANPAAFRDLLFAALRRGEPRAEPFSVAAVLRVEAGPDECTAELLPSDARAGLLRLEGSVAAGFDVQMVAFGVGAWTWAQLEAFAEAPNFDEQPPIVEIAYLGVGPGRSGSAHGEAPAGQVGVACLSGAVEAPTIMLAGPFELAAP